MLIQNASLRVWTQLDAPDFRARVLEKYVIIAESQGKELHLEEIIEDYAERYHIISVLCYACDRANETRGFHRRCIKKIAQAVLDYTNQKLPIVLRLEVNHDQERAEAIREDINSTKRCDVCGKKSASIKCGRCIIKEMLEGFQLPQIYQEAIKQDCEKARLMLEAGRRP